MCIFPLFDQQKLGAWTHPHPHPHIYSIQGYGEMEKSGADKHLFLVFYIVHVQTTGYRLIYIMRFCQQYYEHSRIFKEIIQEILSGCKYACKQCMYMYFKFKFGQLYIQGYGFHCHNQHPHNIPFVVKVTDQPN